MTPLEYMENSAISRLKPLKKKWRVTRPRMLYAM